MKGDKEIERNFLVGEIKTLETSNNKMDKEILVGNIALNIVGGLIMSLSPNIGLGMAIASPFMVGLSLCDYMHLRKNQELKDKLPKFFVEYTKSMPEEDIENYAKKLGKNNKNLRIKTLVGNIIGGMTAGYSLGELLSGDLKWLAGVGIGAMIIYSSYNLYKHKNKKFGD